MDLGGSRRSRWSPECRVRRHPERERDAVALRYVERRPALGRLAAAVSAAFLSVPFTPHVTQAQDAQQAAEASIKGAYLYKFAGYVEWPEERAPSEPFTVGVAGGGLVGDELERLAEDRRIQGRPIRVRSVDFDDALADLDILFIADRERNRLDEWLSRAAEMPVLTVTETSGALSEGSIVNFTIDDDRVRFEISLAAAGRSGLRLDARLLDVAQRVQRAPE